MKNFTIIHPYTLLFLFVGLFTTTVDLQAQSTKTDEVSFKLGVNDDNRKIYEFKVTQPGIIEINAFWRGTVNNLALILNGPGQTGYYVRKDGDSPLKIQFKVEPALLEKGEVWKASIVNFGQSGRVAGSMTVMYPVRPTIESIDDIQIITEQPESTEEEEITPIPDNDELQEQGVKRRILEDGTVELVYTDGTIKRIDDGGYTIINPDGTATSVRYINIPPTTPPQLPADDRIGAYLQWQNESLLDLVKKILNYNEQSINNFLKHESDITDNIYQQMYIRTSYINRLLSN